MSLSLPTTSATSMAPGQTADPTMAQSAAATPKVTRAWRPPNRPERKRESEGGFIANTNTMVRRFWQHNGEKILTGNPVKPCAFPGSPTSTALGADHRPVHWMTETCRDDADIEETINRTWTYSTRDMRWVEVPYLGGTQISILSYAGSCRVRRLQEDFDLWFVNNDLHTRSTGQSTY